MVTVTYRLKEAGDQRSFNVRGTGLTRADAVAEANAKLAMTVGIMVEGKVSDILTEGETGAPISNALYSDAELVLRNGAGKKVAIHLENVGTSISNGTSGLINLNDPLVTAFADAYRDADGNSGYHPFDGYFVR